MLDNLFARRREKRAAREAALKTDHGRRGFMQGMGVAAAGAAAAATAIGSTRAVAQTANMDVAILNFALNLEYLEAEFYSRAAFGYGLSAAVTGNQTSMVTGGSQVPFKTAAIAAYAQEIATEERRHVLFLKAALGGNAVNEPMINLQSSFNTIGSLTGLGANFSPFGDEFSFLLGSYIFEDVGVTAYHGAASLITDKGYLDKAAGILAVEAYHAGLVRTVLFQLGAQQQTAAISQLRSQLDGTYGTQNLDDQGVGNTQTPHIVLASDPQNGSSITGGANNSPPGNNSIAYDRTTTQVLNIVYGSPNTTPGLFFPQGLNGTIK